MYALFISSTTVSRFIPIVCALLVTTQVAAESTLRKHLENRLLEVHSDLTEIVVNYDELIRLLPEDDDFVMLATTYQSGTETLISAVEMTDENLLETSDETLLVDRERWLKRIKVIEMLTENFRLQHAALSLIVTAYLLEPDDDDEASEAIADAIDTIVRL